MGTCGQPGYVFQDFCLKQCIGFIIFCPNQGIDFIIFCLKQGLKGQGMRGRATPPHPRIYRVPPPPSPGSTRTLVWILFFPLFRTFLVNVSQSRGLAVPPRRGTCRLSLVGIGQGTLVCLEILSFFVLNPSLLRDFIIFCLKQGLKGQGMRGRATPPHPRIYRVPPPPSPGSTRTLVWILFFPLFRTFLVNVSQSRGLAVPPRRGTCRLSLVGIGQGTLVCLEIRKTNIISILGFEGVSSFISTAPCHKSQIHLF